MKNEEYWILCRPSRLVGSNGILSILYLLYFGVILYGNTMVVDHLLFECIWISDGRNTANLKVMALSLSGTYRSCTECVK